MTQWCVVVKYSLNKDVSIVCIHKFVEFPSHFDIVLCAALMREFAAQQKVQKLKGRCILELLHVLFYFLFSNKQVRNNRVVCDSRVCPKVQNYFFSSSFVVQKQVLMQLCCQS